MLISFLKRGTLAMLLASFSLIAFAEDAPVYDVDSYPPQFDGQSSSAEAAPPTPALQPMAQPEDAPVPVPSTAQAQPLIAPDQPAIASAPPQAPAVQQQQAMQSLPMDQRVARLEQQLNNATHGDSAAKVDEMQSQMQALRGQIDELNHQIQTLQTQQKTLYTELDKRISQKGASTSVVPSPSSDEASAETDSNTPAGTIKPKVKSKTKTAKAAETTKSAEAATTTASAQPNTAEEQEIYQTAYSQIKAKKYSEAAATLQNMLQKYPSGQFAANAHYWLGELYGLMNKNDQAITEFDMVVKNYPDSPKIADAQLKLGLLYAAQFKWPDAKTSFKKVIANYPGTSSARLASEQLKQIKQTGH
jgi:tol-pal system protein YbgF